MHPLIYYCSRQIYYRAGGSSKNILSLLFAMLGANAPRIWGAGSSCTPYISCRHHMQSVVKDLYPFCIFFPNRQYGRERERERERFIDNQQGLLTINTWLKVGKYTGRRMRRRRRRGGGQSQATEVFDERDWERVCERKFMSVTERERVSEREVFLTIKRWLKVGKHEREREREREMSFSEWDFMRNVNPKP